MKTGLIDKFEEILDDEAKRVVDIVVKLYENNIIVNKDFNTLIYSLIDKKFEYYRCDIELRIYRFLPVGLMPDRNAQFALVSRIESTKSYLSKYIDVCKNEFKDKDHYKVTKGMALKLIDYSNQHEKTDKTLFELMAEFMDEFLPQHNDSVDSRAIALLLQEEIYNNGYEVQSLIPFRIMKL